MKQAVVERFGTEVLGADGEIDRAKVGTIVFADRGQLAWLEQLLHPRVVAGYLRWREELAELHDPPGGLRDRGAAPLRGRRRDPASTRSSSSPRHLRCASRAGSGRLREREQRLLPDEEKAKRADFVYVNDGTLADLDAVRVRRDGHACPR